MNLKIYISLVFALFLIQKSFSQNIFSGGNGDGFGYSSVGGTGTEVPLPIDLLYFTAKEQNQKVKINWTTATETNNDYFTIERSKNAISFEEVGTISGAGNSNTELNYEFYDKNPYKGLSYYRLKQTDFDGKFEYSKVISVNYTNNFIGKLNIYPNPVSNELIIEINDNKRVVNFEIINSMGSVVYKGNLINKTIVQTSDFASGVYLIKFVNGETTEFRKLIKM